MSVFTGYLLFTTAWVCWCGLHSYLISMKVSGRIAQLLGPNYRFFRLGYNLFSLFTLAGPLALGWYLRVNEVPLFIWDGWYAPVRYGLLFLGVLLFFAGLCTYDMQQFLGFSQINSGNSMLLLSETEAFETTGVLGITRHPWYLGGILFIWSVSRIIYPTTMITAVIVSCYFVVGALLEERKLIAHYGESYRLYQQKVSMLIPIKWFRNCFSKMNT